jgi:K(+)-stimulated pyrophosphate-energized sodium pump
LNTYLVLSAVSGLLALGVGAMLTSMISKEDPGNEKMQEISGHIHEGAMAFLYREYKALAIFIVVVAIIISVCLSAKTAACFVGGACFSILAGFFGMNVATKANVRTTQAASKSMSEALKIAFSGGSVMGLGVVGLGIFGLSIAYFVFDGDIDVVTGFGLGASSIALFARVGGGIYTKAADVGADLVGKVEAGIPEDDPRNPAVIADNVGDNVGDVAGMGADLFESYVGAIISAITLGGL